MADNVGARLAARKRWQDAIWLVGSAERQHGRGSQEWLSACQAEHQAQQAYADAAARERATSRF